MDPATDTYQPIERRQGDFPPEYLSGEGVVQHLASLGVTVSLHTLNHWRANGKGPPCSRLVGGKRGRVFYSIAALNAWVRERLAPAAPSAPSPSALQEGNCQ
jgi:hypothetical protein